MVKNVCVLLATFLGKKLKSLPALLKSAGAPVFTVFSLFVIIHGVKLCTVTWGTPYM
jgi:hypothetical protein